MEEYQPEIVPNYNEELPRPLSDKEADFARWQLETERFLDDLAQIMRGKVKNRLGEWEYPKEGEICPRANEKGVQGIITSLRLGVFQHFTRLSIIDEDRILAICYGRCLFLSDKITAKYKEWGIDARDILTLVDDILTSVYLYLSGAIEGQTLKGFQKVYKLQEVGAGEGKEHKSGIGQFFSKKGGK